jgi:phosphoribosylanthranilate isomerase
MNNLRIKVCGMTDPFNVEAICKYTPDYIGFIFYSKSVRYVGKNPDPQLFKVAPPTVLKAAVFVNEYYERIIDITGRYGIDVVQLHGMESPEVCNMLKLKGKTVVKVIPGDQVANKKLLLDYRNCIDYFLFDTPVLSYGGSGRKFNWDVLYDLETDVNFFLSGGITADDSDLLSALDISSFFAVDINSRFETDPGIKDPSLVGNFIKKIRNEKE